MSLGIEVIIQFLVSSNNCVEFYTRNLVINKKEVHINV